MKLSNFRAQRALNAMRSIDANEAIRLDGLVRLDLARNIHRMMPVISSYERVIQRRSRDMVPGEANRAANNKIAEELEKLADKEEEFDLIEIECAKLRLDDNPRITGEFIASIAPILKDFDSMGERPKKAK